MAGREADAGPGWRGLFSSMGRSAFPALVCEIINRKDLFRHQTGNFSYLLLSDPSFHYTAFITTWPKLLVLQLALSL
jgi:hypothetical protein